MAALSAGRRPVLALGSEDGIQGSVDDQDGGPEAPKALEVGTAQEHVQRRGAATGPEASLDDRLRDQVRGSEP